MYKAIIASIDLLEPIEWKDRILKAQVAWSTVIVNNEVRVWDLVVYFPVDGCVTQEYWSKNNLFKSLGGYLESNGRIRCLKLAGVKSDWLAMPLSSLDYAVKSGHIFNKWDVLSEVNGKEVCYKYINQATLKAQGNNWQKKNRWATPMFPKHIDTDQLFQYMSELREWDDLIVTQKVHGTSQRVGYVCEDKGGFRGKLAGRFWLTYGVRKYLVGTRNTIVTDDKPDGWYSNDFRFRAANPFVDKLHKWEVVYYEVVGWENWNTPIMWSVSISGFDKVTQAWLSDNIGIRLWMWLVYSYGCSPGEHKIYVYRIAMVNEDWHILDYSWDQVKKRCSEMQVDHVPELERIKYNGNPRELTDYILNKYEDKADFIDSTHPLEGICVRVDKGFVPSIFKRKTYNFKLWEGIIKSKEDYVDMEESS